MFNEYLRPNPRTFNELKQKVDSIAYRVTKEDKIVLKKMKKKSNIA